MTPDLIADQAILTVSAWRRQALPSLDEAMLLLYRDQARRWEVNDNHSLDDVDRAIAAVVAEIEQ